MKQMLWRSLRKYIRQRLVMLDMQMLVKSNMKLVRKTMNNKSLRSLDGKVVCSIGSKNSCRAVWIAPFCRIKFGVHNHKNWGLGMAREAMAGHKVREREGVCVSFRSILC